MTMLLRPVRLLAVMAAVIGGLGIVAAVVVDVEDIPVVGERVGPTTLSADAPALKAAGHFLERYVERDGRVVRHDQDGDTVSEGQGYALLLAVAVGDEDRFDRIWTWTDRELRRDDGLLSWHWRDGVVTDDQAASDADLEVAWALVLAGSRFDRDDLRGAGVDLGRALLDNATAGSGGQLVLSAGPWATGPPVAVNVSYFVPAAYQDLHAASRDDRWLRLWESSRGLISDLTGGGARLPPDWALVEEGEPRAVGDPGGEGAGRYGLDAQRVPVRLATSCAEADRALAAALWPTLAALTDAGGRIAYDLDGRPLDDAANPLGLVAAAASAHAAGAGDQSTQLLDRAAEAAEASPTYYGDAWVALGRVLLTTSLLGRC